MRNAIYLMSLFVFLVNCETGPKNKESLPYLGHKDIVNDKTVHHTIPDFTFINQYGETVDKETFKNKAFIIDYFFTSCPTICPKVKTQQLRLYERYKDHKKLAFLSVSVDPKYDDVERLNKYAKLLNVDRGNWHFVTGDKDQIYDNAVGFFHTAIENEEAPGGYDHDGKLVLIDPNMHIRGFCDGLIPDEVDEFVYDIENLLDEIK